MARLIASIVYVQDMADLIAKYDDCVQSYGVQYVTSTLAKYKRLEKKRRQYEINLARTNAMINRLTHPHGDW